MTKKELQQWFILQNQIKNGWHLSDTDKKELVRLNHLVMEIANKIHNANMLGTLNEPVPNTVTVFNKKD